MFAIKACLVRYHSLVLPCKMSPHNGALSGVDVFCICPGAIDTPMFQASSLNHLSDKDRAAFVSKLAQGRLITPREIADQILFLCR